MPTLERTYEETNVRESALIDEVTRLQRQVADLEAQLHAALMDNISTEGFDDGLAFEGDQ